MPIGCRKDADRMDVLTTELGEKKEGTEELRSSGYIDIPVTLPLSPIFRLL